MRKGRGKYVTQITQIIKGFGVSQPTENKVLILPVVFTLLSGLAVEN